MLRPVTDPAYTLTHPRELQLVDRTYPDMCAPPGHEWQIKLSGGRGPRHSLTGSAVEIANYIETNMSNITGTPKEELVRICDQLLNVAAHIPVPDIETFTDYDAACPHCRDTGDTTVFVRYLFPQNQWELWAIKSGRMDALVDRRPKTTQELYDTLVKTYTTHFPEPPRTAGTTSRPACDNAFTRAIALVKKNLAATT